MPIPDDQTCGRAAGPEGTCDRHSFGARPQARRIMRANAATRRHRSACTPTTPAPTTSGLRESARHVKSWEASTHPHQYGLDGICTITGCEREQPMWLDGDTLSGPSGASTRRGGNRPLTGKKIALAIAALAASSALLSGIGHALSGQVAEPVGPDYSQIQP